ncbi:hypothetical protein D9757_015388 [Collybiopsis confluens]|uniref:Uncharacterized protein n=1 Tax=Collybiopsis confluens TaxID=2823264 RepID=A0A8H5FFA7_9AGAR|nr:hypothetical protein D9757_015388 [Collybiopsis confluens]
MLSIPVNGAVDASAAHVSFQILPGAKPVSKAWLVWLNLLKPSLNSTFYKATLALQDPDKVLKISKRWNGSSILGKTPFGYWEMPWILHPSNYHHQDKLALEVEVGPGTVWISGNFFCILRIATHGKLLVSRSPIPVHHPRPPDRILSTATTDQNSVPSSSDSDPIYGITVGIRYGLEIR